MERVYSEHNKITYRIYNKYGKYSSTVYLRYGTLNDFKKILCPNDIRKNNISKEDLIKDVLNVNSKIPKMSRDDYIKFGKYSRKPIERYFGSWNKMLIELELNVNCLINIDEDDLLNDLINIYNKFNTISATLIKHHGTYSVEVYQRRFGSINNAFTKAGLPLHNPSSPVAKSMIKIMSDILNEKPILEKTFDWLISPDTGYNFYIDAFYAKANLAFEYDGPQHRVSVDLYGGEEELEKTKRRDYLKAKLLKEHNVDLIRLSDIEPHSREYLCQKLKLLV